MIRLHHVPQARSFRVLWLLEELGERFDVVPHSFFDKSLRSPEYLKLSPAGRVPALEIDGRVLFESGAIVEYLCETRGRLAPPPGAEERPEWLEWLHYSETLGQHLAALTQQHIVLREDWMRSPTVMRLEAKRLQNALGAAEAALAGRDYLLASGFSAVDATMGYGAGLARRFVRLDALPRVAGWLGRLQARPAYLRAQARDGAPEIYVQPFYEVPDA
ncbi:glutathione S-transferase [Defluviimonas sp. 20V17]|uniref:Glutathione S-transferase n=1 Tax=Allgaiera indica TaxID=765699 RepID=A0AAN4UQX1_9RHOB|nr:glutathione S-transferase [Allgaiera indica]KDB02884.1 glutathione S-transferase [Defluviimonas sp. 20V17]GHE01406.1 glutathione S-transferase [Allgaiera indica]SDW86247.1 glutathione S-transferase [Allgaiera indica]